MILLGVGKAQIGLASGPSTKGTNVHVPLKITLRQRINFSDQNNGKILH